MLELDQEVQSELKQPTLYNFGRLEALGGDSMAAEDQGVEDE